MRVRIPAQETALRAQDIVRNAFPVDKRQAKFVAPARVELTRRGYCVYTLTKMKGERARTHKVLINMEPGYTGVFSRCPNIKIQCDCVAGDTMVLTDQGWKSVFSMAADWQPGDSLTMKYVVNGRTYRGSTPFYKGRQVTKCVTFSNGAALTATPDHRVRVVLPNNSNHDRRTFEWRTVDDLSVGDMVMVTNNARSLPEPSRSLAFREAYFLGFWYGDGSFCSRIRPDLQVPAGHKMDALDRIVGLGLVESVGPVGGKNSIQRATFGIKAIEFMARFGITPDTRHVIPQAVLDDPELLFGFVSGLLDADGSHNSSRSMNISGSHELRRLQMALIRFGVAGVEFRVSEAAGTRTNYGERSRDLCSLKFTPNAMRTMGDRLWLVREPDLVDKGQRRPTCTRVKSIHYAGRQHVYDIFVDKIHAFTADTVVVHNCARYKFYWNYALLEHDAAIKDVTNGEPPVVTNPSEVPGVCKHGVISIQHLRSLNPVWRAPSERPGDAAAPPRNARVKLTSLHDAMSGVRRGR